MDDVTKILHAIDNGDQQASDQLLPVVYQELRNIASSKMKEEAAGHTLQATALVHEAYIRLIGNNADEKVSWKGRGHFYASAAEAMRRILIEHARKKGAAKRGGSWKQKDLDLINISIDDVPAELIELDSALSEFKKEEPEKAALVELRFFAGLSLEESARLLGISIATAGRYWRYSRAWLLNNIKNSE